MMAVNWRTESWDNHLYGVIEGSFDFGAQWSRASHLGNSKCKSPLFGRATTTVLRLQPVFSLLLLTAYYRILVIT